MAAVREWLLSVAAVTVLLAAVRQLTGGGTVGKAASFLGGLLLLAALLQPLPGLDMGQLERAAAEMRQELERESGRMAAESGEELTALIESRTAAYISEQAAEMGLRVTADVETEPGPEGIPVPVSAVLRGERSAPLEGWMERELGIPAERQVWDHEG